MKDYIRGMKSKFFGIGFSLLFLQSSHDIFGQNDSTKWLKNLEWFAYFDAYYAYDFNLPETQKRLPFLYHYTRNNGFSINHLLVKTSYADDQVRGNLGLHTGTYVLDNYAAEPDLLRFIYEANVGLKPFKNKPIWLDAGIFESHLGFESALAAKNITVSRSLSAENSPYYNAGASLSLEKDRWTAKILALNGWQVIQKNTSTSFISLGSQIAYEKEKFTVNWSTFAGTNDPDSTRKMRYFSNLYSTFSLKQNWKFTLGFDYGIEQLQKNSLTYNHWYNFTALVQKKFSEKLHLGLRGEYFSDVNQIVIQNDFNLASEILGVSSNIDLAINPVVLMRFEARYFQSNEALFSAKNGISSSNFSLLSSVIFQIEKERD